MADSHDSRREEVENTRSGSFAGIESIEQAIMNIAFVVLLVAISWGVLSRYVVYSPATWVAEVAGISFAWLIFVGAAEVHRRMQHVSVDLLTSTLPLRVQSVLSIAVDLFVIAFCFYVTYLGVRETIAIHSSTTSMLRIPLSAGYSGLTFSFFLMGMRGLQRLVRRLCAAPRSG